MDSEGLDLCGGEGLLRGVEARLDLRGEELVEQAAARLDPRADGLVPGDELESDEDGLVNVRVIAPMQT